MPAFTYKAKDRSGQLINGSLEAESRAAVNTRLQAMGLFPIAIAGDESKEGGGALQRLSQTRAPKIKSLDLTSFYRQMSDLIGAGVPLVKSLSIVKNQTTNPTMAKILTQVNADVQGGDTFAKALEKHPKTFNKLTIALVRAGETGGLLDQTLERVAAYAEAQDELRSKIKAALAYPMIMVFVGAAVIIILLTFVMPKILTIFDEMDQALPMVTQVLVAISLFLSKYILLVVLAAVAAAWLFRRYMATERGATQVHLMMLKLPKFGELILKREIAGFTRTLGSLLRNGVPILNALGIAGEVMSIRPIRHEIEKIPESITQGSGMAPALRDSPLFPSVVVNMVAVGEETGNLPDTLLRVAESYERQVDRDVKTLTSFIEPVIILVLGIVVGFIVIAMLLPLFSIDPSAGL